MIPPEVHLVGNGIPEGKLKISSFWSNVIFTILSYCQEIKDKDTIGPQKGRGQTRKMAKIEVMANQFRAVITAKEKSHSRPSGTNLHYLNKLIFKDLYGATTADGQRQGGQARPSKTLTWTDP